MNQALNVAGREWKMKKIAGFVFCLLGVAALTLLGILSAVESVGTDAKLYHELQMREGALAQAGISEIDLIRLGNALAKCLKGDEAALEALGMVEIFGQYREPFNEKERQHMEDCRELFNLLRITKWTSLAVGTLALTGGIVLLKRRKPVRWAAILGPMALLIPLGAFGCWAATDFNGAFDFFHRVLFTNELWLLDPRTDLLIRICPSGMFAQMGLRIGLMGLMWMLLIPVLVMLVSLGIKERKE